MVMNFRNALIYCLINVALCYRYLGTGPYWKGTTSPKSSILSSEDPVKLVKSGSASHMNATTPVAGGIVAATEVPGISTNLAASTASKSKSNNHFIDYYMQKFDDFYIPKLNYSSGASDWFGFASHGSNRKLHSHSSNNSSSRDVILTPGPSTSSPSSSQNSGKILGSSVGKAPKPNKPSVCQSVDLNTNLLKLITRVDKLEKKVASLAATSGSGSLALSGSSSSVAGAGQKGSVGSFVDAFSRGQIAMTPKTVEICAIVTFFFIGVVLGASLLDRLWLLGGITMSWWASGAVQRNTRGGAVARRLGAQVAQFIRDWQEKYNQAVIFYQTGKLAYFSSKTWEKYDNQFAITDKMEKWKKIAMNRAAGFQANIDQAGIGQQVSDLWQVMLSAPDKAKKLDREYKFTSKVSGLAKGAYGATSNWVGSAVSAAGSFRIDQSRSSSTRSSTGSRTTSSSYGRNSNSKRRTLRRSNKPSVSSTIQQRLIAMGRGIDRLFETEYEREKRLRREGKGGFVNPFDSTPFGSLSRRNMRSSRRKSTSSSRSGKGSSNNSLWDDRSPTQKILIICSLFLLLEFCKSILGYAVKGFVLSRRFAY